MADDAAEAPELFTLLYGELRGLARVMMSQSAPGTTLQPTALVHEAYLKLAASKAVRWESPRHFYLTAAQAMRQILVDRHRRRKAERRGGNLQRVDIDDVEIAIEPPSSDLLALDEALAALERVDARKFQIVTLKYFAGLPLGEVAALLDVSLRTAERDWTFARAFLLDFMERS
jgi:RNA polymerase sigma factor (TIGR02999 family)